MPAASSPEGTPSKKRKIAHEQPSPTPKRRGRPPKAATVPKDAAGDDAPATPKRGRGRPRKVDSEAASASTFAAGAPTAENTTVTPTPKKRGRPRKEPEAKETSPTPKRGRGRPPKPVVEKETSPTPKRGRGRPRKEVTEKEASPTPKRGRGRPRKVPVEATGTDTDTATETAAETETVTPATKTKATPKTAPRSARLSESLAAVKSATPKTKTNDSPSTLPSFDDDVFGTPSASAAASISREAFLANEALRRQREARNFTFEGDVNSPRQTRSGRIVAAPEVEVDEYGGAGTETEDGTEAEGEAEGEVDGGDGDVEMEEAADAPVADLAPLPPKARPHVLRILETLSGRQREPAPFPDEESNEALQGVLALLKSTVTRGEGNSALVTGPRGVGKTRTVERALRLLPSTPAPIIVRLSGHAQTDDRRAIREMGRQIAAAEGKSVDDDDDEDEQPGDFAPTTLPSHLLALLTAPSPRAIIVVIDEFDLFTEHARQALLYCLLDVVQSVQTGPVETTGRGIAVIGITSRVDTLLLLEKRVKSRFSHRVWKVSSPLAPDGPGWKAVLRRALVPWTEQAASAEKDKDLRTWMGDWAFAVDMLLDNKQIAASLTRLAGLTTDVRLLFRPFIPAITAIMSRKLDYISVPVVQGSIAAQLELAGWGTGVSGVSKLRGLPHPALGVLIVAKHLAYAGRTEFSLAQVEDEYLRFARTRLVGSGRARWPLEILRRGFDHCKTLGLLAPAGPASAGPRFAKVRATLSPHEVVAFFRGEGASMLGPELAGWGKLSGGHA